MAPSNGPQRQTVGAGEEEEGQPLLLPTSSIGGRRRRSSRAGGRPKLWGALLGVTAGASDALTSAIMQLADYGGVLGSLWRFSLMLILTTPFLLYSGLCGGRGGGGLSRDLWPINPTTFYFLLQAAAHSNGQALVLFALEKMLVGDVLVVLAMGPILVKLLAHIFLGEKSGLVPYSLAIMSLSGAVVISRPSFITGKKAADGVDNHDALIGTALSFGALCCFSTVFIVLRHIRQMDQSLTTFAYCLWGFLEFLAISWVVGGEGGPWGTGSKELQLRGLLLVSAASAVSLLARFCIVVALRLEAPGPVALTQATKVAFAFLFQYALLGKAPDVWSLVGGSIVLSSVLLMGGRKYLEGLPEGNRTRARWRILLL